MFRIRGRDIDDLSKDKKLQIIDAIREAKKRFKKQHDIYVPNPGQQKVHDSKKRIRVITSGNGSGKTCMAIHLAFWRADGYDPILREYAPVPADVYVVLDLPSKVSDVWLKEAKKWFEIKDKDLYKNGKPYINEIRRPSGSSIKFLFHQQDLLSAESIEVDFVVFDEPPPRNLWISLLRGGRKIGREAKYVLIGTPIAASWIKSTLYDPWVKGERKDMDFFRYGTEVNKNNLSKNYIEEFSRYLSENERKVRLHGEFFDTEGFALAHLFSSTTHVIQPDQFERIFDKRNCPCVVAIDPHPSKNHTAVLIGTDRKDNFFYIKELSKKLVARDFALELKEWYRGYNVIDVVCDSLGNAEMTGGEGFRSFIQILREEGVYARSTTFKEKSDEDFISRIRSILATPKFPDAFGVRTPKLRVLEGCEGIIRDIENASWMRYRDNLELMKEKIDMRDLDYLSCLKYALASNLHYNKNKRYAYKPKNTYYGLNV